jgi:hypothetical protein
MKLNHVVCLCSCIILLSVAPLAYGQTATAAITGRVTDASGAVVVGAALAVTSTETGVTRETLSNDTGSYTVPLLNPGNYQIKVIKEGFRPVTRTGIELHVDQAARVDFSLELGAVAETVEVQASAPLVDSEKSSLGGVVENRQIVDLPLNGRTTTGLAFLIPGVVPGQATDGDSGRNPINLWINGNRGNSSDVLVDGLSLTTPEFNPSLQVPLLPQVDLIQEFKVLTNSLPAEFGRTGGGVVDFVYKSGTNQFHGTAFEFLRNSAMDANNFFNNRRGIPLAAFRRHQFGGTVGGPVLIPHLINGREKLFFFLGYEGLRSATGTTSTLTFPTAAERTGDFSHTFRVVGGNCNPVNIFDPFSTQAAANGGFTRTQFPNNVIPARQIDPVAAKIASFYPLPNGPGDACTGANNYTVSGAAVGREDLPSGRLDYYPTARDRLFLRISARGTQNRGFDAIKTLGRTTNPKPNKHDNGLNAALSYTRTLNPTLIGELRFGLSRILSTSAGTAAGTNADGDNFDMRSVLGWAGSAGSFIDQMNKPLAFPQINVSGYSTMGTGQQAFNNGGGTSYQWAGTVTKIHGAHTLKSGVDYRVLQATGPNAFFASGAYTFANNFTQGPNPTQAGATVGNSLASMLVGVGTGQAQINPRLLVSNNYFGVFVQDDYRITSKLVLNLGLRYDLENGRSERFNQSSYFDFTATSPLASLVPSVPGLHGGLAFVGVNGNPHRQFNTDKNNFGPRAGLAYSVTPGTVIRTGYGLLYEPFIGRSASSGSGYLGFGAVTTWVSSLDGITPYNPLSNPFPNGLTPPSGSSLGLMTQVGDAVGSDGANGRDGAFDRGSVVGYIQQWNVSLQRALPANMALEVGYAGNKGTHMPDGGGFQLDQLPDAYLALGNKLLQTVPNPFYGIIKSGPLSAPTTTYGQLLRPYPQFTNVLDFRPSAASSIYHAFRAQLEKRFSRGFQFLGSYTQGKMIDDSSNAVDFSGLGRSGRHQDVYNRRADRSLSVNDIAHRVVLSSVADLPFGKGKLIGSGWSRPINGIFGGWQVNGIVSFQSGRPLIIENSSNNANAFSDLQRPNVNGDPNLAGGRSTQDKLAAWFNTAVFSQPAAFTFGNSPRVLPDTRSDGIRNLDASLFKNFGVYENVKLQFRCELFNVLNTPQFDLPGMLFGSAGFGVVSAQVNSPRQIQLALKVLF